MASPNDGNGAVISGTVISSTQLVQYDDDDTDDKIDSSHSDHLVMMRLQEGAVTQPMKVGSEGADLEAMKAFYDSAPGVGHGGGVGSGNDYSEGDIPERGMEEAAVEGRVHDGEPLAYLPKETGRGEGEVEGEVEVEGEGEENSSFTSMQQLQLRAQILVYGDLIKGVVPEESLMSSAFADANEGAEQEAERSTGGWNWERTWQVAAEREAERLDAERQVDEGAHTRGDVNMSEGNEVNAAADVFGAGSPPSTSPGRAAEDTMSNVAQAVPGAVPDLSETATDIRSTDGNASTLTANLDAVVENIVAASKGSADGSGLKDTRVDPQTTRSPSLDPWLKPHPSQGATVPGSAASVPSTGWQAASLSNPTEAVAGSQPAGAAGPSSAVGEDIDSPEEGSRKRKVAARERRSPVSKSVESRQAKGKQRKSLAAKGSDSELQEPIKERKTPGRKRAGTVTHGDGDDEKTPLPRGAKSVRQEVAKEGKTTKSPEPTTRRSRARSSDNGPLEANAQELVPGPLSPVQLRLIHESAEAVVTMEGGSPSGSQAGKSSLHAETQNWLEQAKASFEEAVSAANSAAEQRQLVEALTSKHPQTPSKEPQYLSAVNAVNAAASVAKAAADAAKVAYEAAVQAILIVSDGMVDTPGRSAVALIQGDRDAGLAGRKSAISAAREQARKRASASTLSPKTTPQSTDAVLRAARLMAEAASQAGAVLAIGSASGPQSSGPKSDVVKRSGRGRPRKDQSILSSPTASTASEKEPSSGATVLKGSLKKGARRNGKDPEVDESTKTSAQKTGMGQANVTSENVAGRLDLSTPAAPPAADISEILHQDQIAEGSLVEVMNDEEGLRGGWFTAKVLQLKAGNAYVEYDEILADDGSAKLKEWFPVEGPVVGTETGRPRIRLVSPNNMVRGEEGKRKRRKTSEDHRVWMVGDQVDAFVQDGWWEGVVQALDKSDDSKVTVHFPGEGDTSTVKAWNLRPSFLWKDGRWEQWSGHFQLRSQLGENHLEKELKASESPKSQARRPGRKPNLEGKSPTGEAEGSKSTKTKKGTSNSRSSRAVTTRSSPRQKLAPRKKDGPTKLPETEG